MTELEPGIVTDLRDRLTYAGYLRLDRLLDAQQPLSGSADHPVRHDEMLFIVQHQVSELWMKLMIHELRAAIANVRADALEPCFKILARVKLIQKQMFEQWAVLETLTPSEIVEVFRHDAPTCEDLNALLRAPSLYDEFLRHLARRGLPIPAASITRDVTQPYERNPDLVPALRQIYADPQRWWDAYDMCEKLVDVEEAFQLWRFRHMKTVERIIGYKPGTGGSSGVGFLRRALEHSFFPELIDVRTVIGAQPAGHPTGKPAA